MKQWYAEGRAGNAESVALLERALELSVISIQKNQDKEGNPAKRDYFACPKYFCALNLRPMTEKQITDGECGGKL